MERFIDQHLDTCGVEPIGPAHRSVHLFPPDDAGAGCDATVGPLAAESRALVPRDCDCADGGNTPQT
jgi:hypothetical protein